MKTKKFTTTQLAILGLMTAILLIMAYTPLGYLNIGPLAISFNVIPVAICAIVLGPMGGRNIIIGCCMMVGVNAVCEMLSSTLITGAVGAALSKARLLPVEQKGKRK